MYHVWDGSQWKKTAALKVWNGSSWQKTYKFKVRDSISWLPRSISDQDDAVVIRWTTEAPTPPPPPPPTTHPVPDLDLKTLVEIEALLDPLLFTYSVVEPYETTTISTRDDKVVIDSQFPAAGQDLAEGSNVTVRLYNFVQPTTTVPNLDGLLVTQANTAITNAQLVVGTPLNTEETYNNSLIGRVIVGSQYPAANSTVDTGESVVYDYYIQKPFATVPDIVNLNENDIYTPLSNANVVAGTRTAFATSTASLDGKVKSTFPVAGTQVEQGSDVDYVVYEHTLAVVPNLNGLTTAQANAALTAAYLYPGTTTDEETTVVANEGKVKNNSQFPAAGNTVAKDSDVDYTYYVPNTTTTMPNVINMTPTNAVAAVRAAELSDVGNVSFSRVSSEWNKVYMTSPVAGTQLYVGSQVDLFWKIDEPKFVVPNLTGATPSSGQIGSSNFTWGNNTLSTTNTTTESLIGKVATQSLAAGTTQYADPINYGLYVDNRPTVPNVVGQTQSTAQTLINNAGLNYTVTNKAQTYNGQATAGTVNSQSVAAGTRVNAGTYITIEVWSAYVPQAVTRTGTRTLYTGALRSYTSAGTSLSTTYAYHGTFNSTTNRDCFALVNVPYTFSQQSLPGFQITAARYYFYQDHTYAAGTPVTVYVGTHNQSTIPSSITRSSGIVTAGNVSKSVSRTDFTYVTLSATQRAAIWGGSAYGLSIYAPLSSTTGSNYGYHTPNWVEVDYTYTEYV